MDNLIIIKTKEDFEEAFPYNNKYLKSSYYPNKYPCVIKVEQVDGGLAGDFYEISYVYIPDGVKCEESFLAGFMCDYDCVRGVR